MKVVQSQGKFVKPDTGSCIMKYIVIAVFLLAGLGLFAVDFEVKNKDGKVDQWVTADIFKNWKIYDVNGNSKSDESCFYVSEKNIVYLISEETFDSTGSGKPNVWIKFTYKDKNFFKEIKIDSNDDGKIDMFRYEKNDKVYLQKSDENFDGKIDKIDEFDVNGVLVKESLDKITPAEIENDFLQNDILKFMNDENKKLFLSFYGFDKSSNKYLIKKTLSAEDNKTLSKVLLPLGYNDEKMDTFYYYENGKIVKEEHDTNNDGKIDMQVTYVYDGAGNFKGGLLEKDNNYDGKFDEWHHINEKRQVIKVEKDTNFDGKVDDVKNF
jgi:hypothetical protein